MPGAKLIKCGQKSCSEPFPPAVHPSPSRVKVTVHDPANRTGLRQEVFVQASQETGQTLLVLYLKLGSRMPQVRPKFAVKGSYGEQVVRSFYDKN